MRQAAAVSYVLALLLLATTTAAAADAIPRRLPLAEAERILVDRNLPVIAARQGVEIARAQKLVAATSPVPTLSAGLNVVHLDDQNPNGNGPRLRADNVLHTLNVGLSYVFERGDKLELRSRL